MTAHSECVFCRSVFMLVRQADGRLVCRHCERAGVDGVTRFPAVVHVCWVDDSSCEACVPAAVPCVECGWAFPAHSADCYHADCDEDDYGVHGCGVVLAVTA